MNKIFFLSLFSPQKSKIQKKLVIVRPKFASLVLQLGQKTTSLSMNLDQNWCQSWTKIGVNRGPKMASIEDQISCQSRSFIRVIRRTNWIKISRHFKFKIGSIIDITFLSTKTKAIFTSSAETRTKINVTFT